MTEYLTNIDLKEMGKRIRERREFWGFSREALSEQVDITPQFLALVEYGEKGLSLKNIYRLAQVLDTSLDYLMAGTRKNEDEDDELMYARERIMAILCRCSAKELEGMEKIAMIYEATISSMRVK